MSGLHQLFSDHDTAWDSPFQQTEHFMDDRMQVDGDIFDLPLACEAQQAASEVGYA